jgi:hypothetical protein
MIRRHLHISLEDSIIRCRELEIGKQYEEECLHLDYGESHANAGLKNTVRDALRT